MAEARKLIRPSPRVTIVGNDGDRGTLLPKFVEIIEKYDTDMNGHMKRCVSTTKIQPYTDAVSRRTIHKDKISLIVFR